jgi:hypothetical protein
VRQLADKLIGSGVGQKMDEGESQPAPMSELRADPNLEAA